MRPETRTVGMVAYALYPHDPRVRREAESLARAGLQVTVVALRGEGQSPRESLSGVDIVRVPLQARRGGIARYVFQYGSFGLLAAWALAWRRGPRIDAVHVHSLPDFLVLAALPARLLGRRVVLDLHESMAEVVSARRDLPPGAPLVRLARALTLLSTGVAHAVVTVNETVAGLLTSRGTPREKIVVVPNAPSLPRDRPRPPAGDRLVVAGGVNAERDLETLLTALAEIRRERPLRIAFYGPADPEYRERLRSLAAHLGMTDAVEFHGFRPLDEILGDLAASPVGVATYARNPSTVVALPTKAFEFALLRRPLVIADLPAMREQFDGAALFYTPGDATGLATALRHALRGGPEVDAMVQRASRLADELSWERTEGRLLALYARAVQASPPGAAVPGAGPR